MIRKLLFNIAYMVILIILGTLDLLCAIAANNWWMLALSIFGTLVAYFVAWLTFRDAREIAKGIDDVFALTLTEMDLLTQVLKRMLSENEAPADDHEDTGHPV